jgi:DNA-binding transcriptional ArsR family regulator
VPDAAVRREPGFQEILGHLSEHEAATSTTIAEALGENTGTTSYHLRVLADAGIVHAARTRRPHASGP